MTPPVCCHCGRLMIFTSMSMHPRPWEESWRCPDGRWTLTRTVPPPPGYAEPAALPPPLTSQPIEWLTITDLAVLLNRSVSSIRHLPPTAIPGRHQRAKGCKVRWNKQIVTEWIDRLCREAWEAWETRPRP